jgi:hypothetical protein
MKINKYSKTIEQLQLNVAGENFLPNLHKELSNLSRQLDNCLCLWISHFAMTQTFSHRLFRQCINPRTELIETDLLKHQQCLIDLDQTIHRLQVQHQEGLNRLLEHYFHRISEGDSYSNIVPYLNSDEADSIFIAYYAMYYSTTNLAQTVLTLGGTIHTILELEVTHLYRSF